MVDFENRTGWIQNDDLFSGEKIYLHDATVDFAFTSLNSYKPTTKVAISQSGEIIGDSANASRRAGVNSYDGMQALNVTVNGNIDLDSLGAVGGYTTITPGVVYTWIANGHRTYNFFDSKIGSALINDPVAGTTVPYTSSGIPVIITDINVSSDTSENIITYTINLREDL